MTVKSGQPWSGVVVTRDATGALLAPTVGPVGTLYVNGVANGASVTVSGANPYKWTVTLPDLAAGDCVSMYITATIDSIATGAVVAEDVADTKRVSELNDLSAQQVRDAMKLAPSAGDPTDGSVDAHLDAASTLTPAQVNEQVVDALTVDVIADSVPVDGNRPTIAQALYMIVQFLTERDVSGTTCAVKKPDGSTTLYTLTLNDASAPTSITRSG